MTRRTVALLLLASIPAARPAALVAQGRGTVELEPCPLAGRPDEALCGSYRVWENRETRRGRTLDLAIVVLPSRGHGRPEPILYLAGGPGGSATRAATGYVDSRLRRKWEMVFVDQRGTGQSNPLPCEQPGSADSLQGYFDGAFSRPRLFRRCKRQLQKIADLRLYNTPVAVDDLDEVRQAMGYEQVDLLGLSWGSRTGLVYLRRHPGSVRAAVLESVVPLAITYPLYHAQGAQRAVDLVLGRCAEDSRCASAFPDLTVHFREVLERLGETPANVTIQQPQTGAQVTVEMSRSAYGESLRYLLWAAPEWLPYLVSLAYDGDYRPIAQFLVDWSYGLGGLQLGQLLSVVCPGDVERIDPADIPVLTDGTFMGGERVRQTLAICRFWPRATMPLGYGEPVVSQVPLLLWSGAYDSASRPEWVDEILPNLPNARHLVVEQGHTPSGRCVDRVSRRFLRRGSAEGLGTGCARRIRLPPFEVPS